MDTFTVLTALIVIFVFSFLTLRLIIKYCKPWSSTVASSPSATDTEAPDFARVGNHLFVSNTPHTCMLPFPFVIDEKKGKMKTKCEMRKREKERNVNARNVFFVCILVVDVAFDCEEKLE